MKIVLLLLIMAIIVVVPNSYAQSPNDFGYKMMPEKLVEGTEGILQVYGLTNN
ncbi:MAG: hypothetical protein H2B03_08975, partial [Nitrosopumilaceae archaeon]|nr:hypothetical protein [Nitrosopumilaceae archaeon]